MLSSLFFRSWTYLKATLIKSLCMYHGNGNQSAVLHQFIPTDLGEDENRTSGFSVGYMWCICGKCSLSVKAYNMLYATHSSVIMHNCNIEWNISNMCVCIYIYTYIHIIHIFFSGSVRFYLFFSLFLFYTILFCNLCYVV